MAAMLFRSVSKDFTISKYKAEAKESYSPFFELSLI